MMTSLNGNISTLLAICEGNNGPSQRPVTRSFDVFFDLCLKKNAEQTIETPVIWNAIALSMTSL